MNWIYLKRYEKNPGFANTSMECVSRWHDNLTNGNDKGFDNRIKLVSMKTLIKLLGVFVLGAVLFTACSKDDDPADNDVFVGTYRVSIGYITSGESKTTADGTVRVVKVGNNYNFIFSDGIPDLNGVEFRRDGDNTVISDDDVTKYIRITANSLNIAYAKDGAVWSADCSR